MMFAIYISEQLSSALHDNRHLAQDFADSDVAARVYMPGFRHARWVRVAACV